MAKKTKKSTVKGEAREKIIAGLTEHHNYNDDDSCLNTDPIQVNKFAEKNGVSASTVSEFLKNQFGGFDKYKAACRDPATIAKSLRIINGELTPSILVNRLADDHADTVD